MTELLESWVSASVSDHYNLRLCQFFYVLIPWLPWYSSPHLRFHTSSYNHPGVARLRPSISVYRTRSTAYPGIPYICPIILTTRSASLTSPGTYCLNLPSCCLLILSYRESSSRFARICLSDSPWHQHASFLRRPPSQPISPAHISTDMWPHVFISEVGL